jgi:hypothetical protein
MVMLALALVMLIDPKLMSDISGSIIVFVSAIAVSFLIIYLHRYILPKFGIRIGSEKEIAEEREDESKKDEIKDENDDEK